MPSPQSDIRYPRLAKRLQAALLDAIIFVSLFFGLAFVLSAVDFSGVLKAAIFALAVLILEPGLVSMTGGTIGHHALGLRIQNKDTGANLKPHFAFFRFLLKSLIGWMSFVFVLVTKRHQAIHDIFSNSVVTIRNPDGQEGFSGEPEREIYLAEFEYPTPLRRVLVILLYIVAMFVAVSVIFALFLSDGCISQDRCTLTEWLVEIVVSVVWVVFTIGALVLGWTGRLPGARRTPRGG